MVSVRIATRLIPLGVVGGLGVLAVVSVAALPIFFSNRVLPGVTVRGIPLGGLTADEARAVLARVGDPGAPFAPFVTAERESADPETSGRGAGDAPGTGVSLTGGAGTEVRPALRDIGVTLDVQATVGSALAVGREPGLAGVARRFALLRAGADVAPRETADRAVLSAYLTAHFGHLTKAPQDPAWDLTPAGTLVFRPGVAGTEISVEEVLRTVEERLVSGSREPIAVRTHPQPSRISDIAARVAGAAVRAAVRSIVLFTGDAEVNVPREAVASWVREDVEADGSRVARIDRGAIARSLSASVAPEVERPPRDAAFAVAGDHATFTPPAPGLRLLVPESAAGILQGLAAGAERITLVTEAVPPAVTVTSLMAQYGVRALLATGESDFSGSPKNRVHNIRVGSARYDGLLVPPREEFSFNVHLGPVDGAHGYLRELVILSNVTTPQFGGGLCQVSTTMFRAAVHAGLPITARKNHAYPVVYYGTPGFDATIYPPNPDLRFRNDTSGHLLIRTKLVGTKLAFEVWGTPDGREVEVLGPFPFDRKPDGAVKARLVRKIRRGLAVQRDEWFSNYRSPKLFPKVLAANAERETWEERARRIAEKDQRIQEEFERRKAELAKSAAERVRKGNRASASPAPKESLPTPRLKEEAEE